MQIKILYKIVLMSPVLILFANEKLKDDFKIFSNIEKEITNKTNKSKPKINKSNKINYPHKKINYYHEIRRKKNKNFKSYNKEHINNHTNGTVKIKKSKKIYYPQDKINIQESNLEKNVWYNIKVYPTNIKDRFNKIKLLNNINTKIKKDFALIGPILEDNLGEITKALNIRGYNELEYIKLE
ncbi:hypothetical protein [Borrelia crocidurae]|uniref:hypothetical protein n=1 Tax=Borrelia crocidurae TaxID=29520 RepID=UPI00058B7C20|nr:hypothetical protein [Borrelia crocidurae]